MTTKPFERKDEINAKGVESEAEFYRKRVDELAGDNLRLDFTVSALTQELRQKRMGLALLANLQQTILTKRGESSIFASVAAAVHHALPFDAVYILTPTESPAQFQLAFGTVSEARKNSLVDFPGFFKGNDPSLLVNKGTLLTPELQTLQRQLDVPYFAAVPIQREDEVLGILVAGRAREYRPHAPPIDKGDVEVFRAVADLIAATFVTTRIRSVEEFERVKSAFFAQVSHDLKYPAQLTLDGLDAMSQFDHMPETLKQTTRALASNQLLLIELIDQILELSRFESDGVNLCATKIDDPNRFAIEASEPYRTLCEEKGLRFVFELDPRGASIELFLDATKISHVFSILLAMSLKYTQEGAIKLRTRINADRFEIEFEDSGTGRVADRTTQVFEHHVGGRSAVRDGSGIGLALVRRIMSLHQGSVEVKYDSEQTNIITLVFPLGCVHLDMMSLVSSSVGSSMGLGAGDFPILVRVEPTARELDEIDQLNLETERSLHSDKLSLLFVDDDRETRLMGRSCLKEKFNVWLAPDGESALRHLLTRSVDVVVSDFTMPKMNGPRLLASIRSTPILAELPFLMMRSRSALESTEAPGSFAADDYLQKPFSPAELFARACNMAESASQKRRLKDELAGACSVLESIFPSRTLTVANGSVESLWMPCENITGDAFDFVHDQAAIYFALLNSSERGSKAVGVAVRLQKLFRDEILPFLRADQFAELSEALKAMLAAVRIPANASIQLGKFNPRTGRVDHLSASSPPAIQVSGHRAEIVMESLGLDRRFHTVWLNEGEALLYFTAGAFDFRTSHGEVFGFQRLLKAAEAINSEASWRASLLRNLAWSRGESPFDRDFTVLRLSRELLKN